MKPTASGLLRRIRRRSPSQPMIASSSAANPAASISCGNSQSLITACLLPASDYGGLVETHQRPQLALALRLAAAGVLATLLMLVKYTAEAGVALPEILFWRQVMTIPIIAMWLAAQGGRGPSGLGRLSTKRLPVHGRRAVLGVAGMICNFGAVLYLPLAESTTLGFTTPIFAVILSALLLRERVGRYRWSAVLLGFAGVIVIAQPGNAVIPPLGAALALSGGLLVALISIQIRDLTRTDEPISVVFWFAALSSPVYALALPFTMTTHSSWQWLLLMAIGLVGGLGQLLLTASLRYGQVASVIVMDYSQLVWAILFGWMIWDHLPPIATWLGAPLIVSAGAIIAWREHRLAQAGLMELRARNGV